MARNSRHFDQPYDVLTALEEVITDALDQWADRNYPDPPTPTELTQYLAEHFKPESVIEEHVKYGN